MSSEPRGQSASLEAVLAPVDGAGLYLGYQSIQVWVSATGARVEFHYVSEPPHGDALLEMRLQQRIFPGLVWGSTTYWSSDGRYLVLDWAGTSRSELRRTCVLVDLEQWRYVTLDDFRPTSIGAEEIAGTEAGSSAQTVRLDQMSGWRLA